MRPEHFEALRPLCPLCRADRGEERPLVLATIAARGPEGTVLEGMLHCPSAACRREYPVIDGVPVIVGPLRTFLAEAHAHLSLRDDLSPEIESALGDCCGPGSAFDLARSQAGSYAWDHWADQDPEEAPPAGGFPRPGAALRLLERGLALAGEGPTGPALEVGCSAGRTTFALAARTGGLALGVDLHLGMLRLAQRALLRGEMSYARRRVGLVYDRRRFPVTPEARARVDFWACDALALPFADRSFALAAALNVLDCVRSPRDALVSLGRVLRDGGKAVLSTPYDWSAAATPVEAWLGGHSQRGPGGGASEPVLRALLDPAGPDGLRADGLALEREEADVPWHVRLHERAAVSYRTHLVVARAAGR